MAFNNNIFRLIEPFIDEVQVIENTLSDLRLKRSIDAAQGTQLDNIGDILNLVRVVGDSDAAYRGKLKLEVVLHRSAGEAERIISFVEEITNIVTVTAKLEELAPAKYRLSLLGPAADILKPPLPSKFFKDLRQKVEKITASGVGVDINFQESTLSPFAFGNEGAEVTDGDGFLEEGFDEITGSYTAGAMAEEGF